ncbi:MAG: GNAT family N-acetyltransferase [Actinomycetota bacterium]
MEIATARLVLVPLDADERAAISGGRRDGRRWADDYPTEGDVVIAGMSSAPPPWSHFQVRERASGLAVGGVGFHGVPADGVVEIGYGLAESARGNGYATEAVRALVDLAREHGATAVIAHTDAGNAASDRVLARVGFTRPSTDDASAWRLDL